jgi:hypothetical protein
MSTAVVGGGEREDGQVAVHPALRGAYCRDQEAARRGKSLFNPLIHALQGFKILHREGRYVFKTCWYF